MKKLLVVVFMLSLLMLGGRDGCFADDVTGLDVSMKQGFLLNWDNPEYKLNNLTTFEVMRTRKVESWGNWNALWVGWTLDAGFAYDSITGRDITYDEDNEVLFTPTENS